MNTSIILYLLQEDIKILSYLNYCCRCDEKKIIKLQILSTIKDPDIKKKSSILHLKKLPIVILIHLKDKNYTSEIYSEKISIFSHNKW